MRSINKRVECRIDVDMGRFTRERISTAIKNVTKTLRTCVGAGGGYIKKKFLKHYQVFFITISGDFTY